MPRIYDKELLHDCHYVSYRLDTFGEGLENMVANATIAEVDRFGDVWTYALGDASDDIYQLALDAIVDVTGGHIPDDFFGTEG